MDIVPVGAMVVTVALRTARPASPKTDSFHAGKTPRSAASSAGAAVVGVMTLGFGAKSVLRNASTAMQPSILLPVQDIHAIVRQYVPTIHDLVFHMRNGRRFRLSCSIMEAQQDEVEAIAIAIEELQAKQGGNR